MLKAQLHSHIKNDLEDYHIKYSVYDLIDKAYEKKFEVLAITCHNKFFYDNKAKRYASNKGIILLFGIEKNIECKHTLIINCNKNVEKVHNFKDLEKYKKENPYCLVIAPHPFFKDNSCLKNKIVEFESVFDAFEYSFFYTKKINMNNEMIKISNKLNKPVIGTSDVHYLKDIDLTYTLIDSKKDTNSIISAIKKGKVTLVSRPLKFSNLMFRIGRMIINPILHFKSRKP